MRSSTFPTRRWWTSTCRPLTISTSWMSKIPHTYGGLTTPDWYMEFRVKMHEAMDQALLEIKKEADCF